GDALYQPESRAALRKLEYLGFTDAFRACNTAPGQYTFWDYQAGSWRKNLGIRIDHIMLSPQAADRLRRCEIDRDVRGGERPSDHVPVWCELDI
ncbi:MAG TPA: endonuclease/exonuclease/phosphatase family protein, partial [Rhizomicrobium sp.]